MGKEIHVNVMCLPLLFHMAQSCMKCSGCLAWIWKNVLCLRGPGKKKIASRGIFLQTERTQALPIA